MTTNICKAKNPATCKYHGQPATRNQIYHPKNQPTPTQPTYTPDDLNQIQTIFENSQAKFQTYLCENGENLPYRKVPKEYKNISIHYCQTHNSSHILRADIFEKNNPYPLIASALHITVSTLPKEQQNYYREQIKNHYRETTLTDPLLRHVKTNNKRRSTNRKPPPTNTPPLLIETTNIPEETLLKFHQCVRKKQYNNPNDAKTELQKDSTHTKQAYQCPHCNKTHIGTPPSPTQTEQEKILNAKITWNKPAYRQAVNQYIKTVIHTQT